MQDMSCSIVCRLAPSCVCFVALEISVEEMGDTSEEWLQGQNWGPVRLLCDLSCSNWVNLQNQNQKQYVSQVPLSPLSSYSNT